MKPPEFYEYIGRVATCKYKSLEDVTLSTKIEHLLDLIFPVFNLERNTAVEGDDLSSEDSVDFDEVDLSKILIKDFYEHDDSD